MIWNSIRETLSVLEESFVSGNFGWIDFQHLGKLIKLFELLIIGTARILYRIHPLHGIIVFQILPLHNILWSCVFIPKDYFGILIFLLLQQNATSLIHFRFITTTYRFRIECTKYFITNHLYSEMYRYGQIRWCRRPNPLTIIWGILDL